MPDMRTLAPLLSTVVLALACGDDGGNDGANIEPTFSSIYENVLSDVDRCLSCHDSTITDDFFANLYREGGELDFSTPQAAYDQLVGQAADGDECEGFGTLVVAGDPDASIFLSKVEDSVPVCGERMPIVIDDNVTTEEIAAIREWIRLGAAND